MCGLAGFVEAARRAPFEAPAPADLARLAREAAAVSVRSLTGDPLKAASYGGGDAVPAALLAAAHALRRPAALDLGPRLAPLEEAAAAAAREVRAFCDAEEALLEEAAARLAGPEQETVASRILALRDAAWSLDAEFLGMLARARDLAGPGAPPKLLHEMRKLTSTLDSIDRIEVRGRDSAGILVAAVFPSAKEREEFRVGLANTGLADDLARRTGGADLLDGAISIAAIDGPDRPAAVAFVRKVAAEVGKLGDNVAALRARIREDGILRAALVHPASRVIVLGHTRWASNGIIHEANAHPVDNATVPAGSRDGADSVRAQGEPHPVYGKARGRVFVALNGDVDNHFDLIDAYERVTGLRGSPRVTTDTKAIALEVDRRLREGQALEEAFRGTAASLEGSAAVAMWSDLEPGRVFLSLRGSGQSLYVGNAPDGWVIASEVYGLVHETQTYAALEGERERIPGDRASRGTIVVLDSSAAAGPPALRSFGGAEDAAAEPRRAQITTRDVDRGAFPHFFRKEIEQSPISVAKTLRGKFAPAGAGGRGLRLHLGPEILPPDLEKRLRDGKIRSIACVGQGTASVAAAAIAALLEEDLGTAGFRVRARKASEMSGFGLRDDMSDTLVIAVTQSGSTADTNRAVDLARRRGAAVIAIVNRRNSDISRRADGVFHTSDGRDIEMSVASTKAFHAQVAAGAVLSLALARVAGTLSEGEVAERAAELKRIPDLLREVLALDPVIAAAAAAHAPSRRHWAIVGSGLNRIAAEEIRIKCSELCYKSISADTVEDKKHIDLSSEPLMVVFAAGNPPAVQGDLAKDVAIFQAHKALPVVFADRGDARYDPYAEVVIPMPPSSPRLAMLAQVMAGHLFAYHAARAVDEGARFFTRLRASVVAEMLAGSPSARESRDEALRETAERLHARRFESALGPAQAGDLLLLLSGAFGAAAEAVVAALTEAVRELERPVDAIRHQAKIVTVGTSRTAERPEGPLFDSLEEAGVPLDEVPEAATEALRSVQPAVESVEGWARYRVEGLGEDGAPVESTRLVLERRGGVSASLPSRAEGGAPLKGTKRSVVGTRRPFVGIGAKDGRSIAILPLVDARLRCTALALLHLRFRDAMPVEEKVRVLGPRRLEEVVNGVTEADIPWSDALLDPIPPRDLFARSTETLVATLVARAKGGQAAG